MSGKTANLGLGVLRAVLNAAKRRGEILHNPCDAIAGVAERSDEWEPFTDADVAVLLRTAGGTDWQGAVLVAAWTGLRLADVAGLTWGNVDLAAGILPPRPTKPTSNWCSRWRVSCATFWPRCPPGSARPRCFRRFPGASRAAMETCRMNLRG